MVLIMQATLLSSFTILLHNKKRWLTLGWSILVRQETISGLFKTVDLFKYNITEFDKEYSGTYFSQ